MNSLGKFKRLAVLISGILTCYTVFSQENYIDGYIIKNNADTVFGFVDYRNWKNNPNEIKFKTQTERNLISFKPSDILEFRVQDEIYVSGIIKTEVSPIQTEKLIEYPQINVKIDTAFLQTLFEGRKSLYFYKNSEGREYFYIKQDGGLKLLIYKRYLSRQNGKLSITENKKYIGQLAWYLSDCSAIHQKLEETSYKQESLTRLFQHYYECSQSDIYFQKGQEKVQTEIGLSAGVTISTIKFSGEAFSYLVNSEFNTPVNFSTCLFFEIIFPRAQRKWSVNNELLFSSYKFKGVCEEFENDRSYTITTSIIGFSYLKLNNLIRFRYPIGHSFIFFNGGISNGFAVRELNYKKEDITFYTTLGNEEGLALNDPRRYEQSFILGAGLKFNKMSLELRYERGTGISKYIMLNSTTQRYFCLMGYRF